MAVSFHEPLLSNQEVESVSKDASIGIIFKYKWFTSYSKSLSCCIKQRVGELFMVLIIPYMGNRINSFRSCYETGVYT